MSSIPEAVLAAPICVKWLKANPPAEARVVVASRAVLIKFRAGWRLRILPAARGDKGRFVDLEAFPDTAGCTCWLPSLVKAETLGDLVTLYEFLSRQDWVSGEGLQGVRFSISKHERVY